MRAFGVRWGAERPPGRRGRGRPASGRRRGAAAPGREAVLRRDVRPPGATGSSSGSATGAVRPVAHALEVACSPEPGGRVPSRDERCGGRTVHPRSRRPVQGGRSGGRGRPRRRRGARPAPDRGASGGGRGPPAHGARRAARPRPHGRPDRGRLHRAAGPSGSFEVRAVIAPGSPRTTVAAVARAVRGGEVCRATATLA